MAKLLASRSAQYLMETEFTFNFDDTIVNSAGLTKTFGAVYTDAVDVTALNLPEGAVVVGGEAVVEVQGVGPTAYTVSLGDSVSATRYLNGFDLKQAVGSRTALTLTGYRTSENMRLTIASTVANASAGKATIRVFYVLPNRANEVIPN